MKNWKYTDADSRVISETNQALIDELDQLNKTLKVMADGGRGDAVLTKNVYQQNKYPSSDDQ